MRIVPASSGILATNDRTDSLGSMWRRIGTLAALLLLAAGCGEQRREWTFVYVMSYDNDLSIHAGTILDAIEEGVKDDAVAVAVLADLPDEDGLRRHVITASGRTEETLGTDDSASPEVLAGFLDWVEEHLPAKRYALVFLDHGGGLDEMCLDRNPGGKGGARWLSARTVGPLLREFRDRAGGEVELLFLQQCARGTIENLYNFRGAARAVLASQTRVGAPNTYYRATLMRLSRNPACTGFDVAEEIVWDDEHFTSYVCVDGEKIAELPGRLDPLVGEFLGDGSTRLLAPTAAAICYPGVFRPDETTYDLLDWLDGLARMNRVTPPALAEFRTFVEDELIVHHRKHPLRARAIAKWTGLGLFVPALPEVRARYEGYPLWRDSRLDELWAAIYTP